MGRYYAENGQDEPCFRPDKPHTQRRSDRMTSLLGGFATGLLLSNPIMMLLFNTPLQELITSNYFLLLLVTIILLVYNLLRN